MLQPSEQRVTSASSACVADEKTRDNNSDKSDDITALKIFTVVDFELERFELITMARRRFNGVHIVAIFIQSSVSSHPAKPKLRGVLVYVTAHGRLLPACRKEIFLGNLLQ